MPLMMAVLKTDHPKELKKTKAAASVQPHMRKWHFSKSAKVTRWSWLLGAAITCWHATECRVQAESQQGWDVTPHSCGTSSWVLCQQTSRYCLHICSTNTLFFPCKWIFCSFCAGNLCMRRNSQNPKEISDWKENMCSVLDSFAGSKAGWPEGSAPSGCILHKREGKASKPNWFPLQWLQSSLLIYTAN